MKTNLTHLFYVAIIIGLALTALWPQVSALLPKEISYPCGTGFLEGAELAVVQDEATVIINKDKPYDMILQNNEGWTFIDKPYQIIPNDDSRLPPIECGGDVKIYSTLPTAFLPPTPSPTPLPPLETWTEEVPFIYHELIDPGELGLKLFIVSAEEYQEIQILPELGDNFHITYCESTGEKPPFAHSSRIVMSYMRWGLDFEMPSYGIIQIDGVQYRLGEWCQPDSDK